MKKKITLLCIILFCFISQGRAQTVGFEYDDDGNVSVRHILTMPKQNTKAIIEAPKPVTEEIGEQKITIYPVPTRGLFQVAVTLLDSKKKNYFSLYSLSGARILDRNISNESTEIDISNYPAGTYLLDVYLGEKVSRWKVIKQ